MVKLGKKLSGIFNDTSDATDRCICFGGAICAMATAVGLSAAFGAMAAIGLLGMAAISAGTAVGGIAGCVAGKTLDKLRNHQ